MSKPKLMLLLIVFLSVVVVPFNTNGAGPKIYLGISGISFDYIPFWYAKDFRLYEKYNVDLDMITTGGGTVLAQAMLSGGVHFAAIGTAFLQSSMQGADHVLLAAHINYFPYRVVGLPSIAGKEGLRGATIAISRFGSNADTALRPSTQPPSSTYVASSSPGHSEPLVDLRTPQHRQQEPATLRRPRWTLEQEMRQILRPVAIAEGTLVLPLCMRATGDCMTVVGAEHANAHSLNLSHLRRLEIAQIGP